MILNIVLAVIGVVAIAGWMVLSVWESETPGSTTPVTVPLTKRSWIGIIGLVLILLSASFVQVNAGEVGIIRRFGKVTGGTLQPGLHVRIPLADRIMYYNTKQMVYETSDNPETSQANYTDYSVKTMTKDGQRIVVRFSVVFSIRPDAAGQIANTLGTEQDVVEKVIKSNARSEGRNIPKKFSAQELYSEQVYECQAALSEQLKPVFEENGVVLHELLLRDIGFAEQLAQALERKQVALEDAITSQRQVAIKQAEASQTIAAARGAKEATVIEAQGQALAIKLVQDQLARSPRYAEYILAKGLAEGKTGAQTIYLPSDMLPLINVQPAAK